MERDSELSTREDLHEQLLCQQSVHRQLKEELRREAESIDQYLELLIQLQRNGKFYQPRALLGRKTASGDKEARFEEENEILRKEIRALSLQLDRVSSDKTELERGRETLDWKARRSSGLRERQSLDHVGEEEESLKRSIAELEDALKQARSGNKALTLLVAEDRTRVEAFNSELIGMLSKAGETCGSATNPDLDQLIRSSIEISARLRQERNSEEAFKEERGRARDTARAQSSGTKNRTLSREEAERALHVLAASPAERGRADALRRLCLGVLCAVRREEENAKRIAAHNRHLFKRLDLLKSRVAQNDEAEDVEKGLRPEHARSESERVADASVAFEQPAVGSLDWLRSSKRSSTSML